MKALYERIAQRRTKNFAIIVYGQIILALLRDAICSRWHGTALSYKCLKSVVDRTYGLRMLEKVKGFVGWYIICHFFNRKQRAYERGGSAPCCLVHQTILASILGSVAGSDEENEQCRAAIEAFEGPGWIITV